MVKTEVETRISNLENELSLLKEKIAKIETKENKVQDNRPWYEKIAGTFADDPAYDEAMRLGREYRLSQRENYDKNED